MNRSLPVLLLLLAPAASADVIELTFEARETDCPDDRTYCFVVDGNLDQLAPGDTARVTFRNAGSIEHNLLVAEHGDAEVGEDTFASAAFFEMETIGSGEEVFGNFTVPAGTDGLYFWCDVPGHEQIGMWVEKEFPDEGGNGAPLLLWPAVVALAVAASLARR